MVRNLHLEEDGQDSHPMNFVREGARKETRSKINEQLACPGPSMLLTTKNEELHY